MANVFANLPLPAFNGPGADVDVSGFGSPKTITCVGTFDQTTITIEVSVDGGAEWAPIAVFQSSGSEVKVEEFAANRMRTNVSGRKTTVPFAADLDVAAPAGSPQFTAIALPVGNGAGVAVDISTFDPFLTVISGGDFAGASIQVQISEDNVEFGSLGAFTGQGGIFNRIATANWVRAFVSGRKDTVAFSGTLALGAVSSGAGISGIDIENEGVPIVGTPNDTLNFVGAGVTVADVGGVATVTVPGFSPARTLFVSPVWPAGVDPLVYFTTIAAALTQAALFAGLSNTNPAAIVIYPGTYVETLTLVSNVSMFGTGRFPVTINGNVTWAAGAGVNAPQAALTEQIELVGVAFGLAGTVFTYNSTAKSAGNCVLLAENVNWVGVAATGRNLINSDNFFNYNCNFVFGASAVTFTDMLGAATSIGVEIVATRYRGLTFAGSTIARIQGGEQILRAGSTIALTGTASVELLGVNINNPVSAAAGCIVDASGCNINALLSGAGAFDVRGCDDGPAADLTGITGTCNRTTWNVSFGPTAVGANAVVFVPVYPDATYNVSLQLTAGPGNAGATVTAKAGGGFTLTDVVGGNTFDLTVIHS